MTNGERVRRLRPEEQWSCYAGTARPSGPAFAHEGTIEGARAVWSFMAQNLGIGMSVDKAVRSGAIEMADKYRRELEAMR